MLLVGRKQRKSPPMDERPYGTKRMKLLFEKGPIFYAEYNIRLFLFLLFHRAHLLLSNDLDTILPNYFISRLKGSKMVFDSHEYFTETPELVHRPKVQKVWKRIEGFVVPKLDEMITVCDSIADLFREKYGVKCHVIRNIPPRKALPTKGDKTALGLPADKHILVLQGSGINIQRGAEELVQTMALLDDCFLMVIGGGDVLPTLKDMVEQMHNEVVREIVYKAEWSLTWLPAVQVAGIILYSRTVTHLLYHLQVILHPLLQALGFQAFAYIVKVVELLLQVVLDHADSFYAPFSRGYEIGGREYRYFVEVFYVGSGYRVYEGQGFDLVAEEFDPDGFVGASQEYIHGVSADPEGASAEIDFGPAVVGVHEHIQQACKGALFSFLDYHRLCVEILRIAYSVQAGNAGNHNHVAPSGHQGRGCAQPQLVYLVVDGQVFLDVGVCDRQVGFRLVVVVIRYEIFNRVGGEETLEFAVQLGGQGLVVAEYQCRTLESFDYVGHSECLAGAGHSEQSDIPDSLLQGLAEPVYGLRLVPGRLVWRFQTKLHPCKNNYFFSPFLADRPNQPFFLQATGVGADLCL